jgi:hypothetical protein
VGIEVDTIDHRGSNFNQMRGVEIMRRTLSVPALDETHRSTQRIPFRIS